MAGRAGFATLDVCLLGERISDHVWKLVAICKPLARDTIGTQMIRSVDSIGANRAEGSGRGTYRDNCHFVNIARGSLYETRHWLRRAFCHGLLTQKEIETLTPLIAELSPMLNSDRNSLKAKMIAEVAASKNKTHK
jgi:four helix bundle protein